MGTSQLKLGFFPLLDQSLDFVHVVLDSAADLVVSIIYETS